MNDLWKLAQSSSIGFDKMFNEFGNFIHNHVRSEEKHSFPPYNLLKLDEKTYKIEFALAGYDMDKIEVSITGNVLSVHSNRSKSEINYHFDDPDWNPRKFPQVLKHGISAKNFNTTFKLAKNAVIDDVSSKDGILTILITVEPEIPEEPKTKKIEIVKK